jgi:hypothetical protein
MKAALIPLTYAFREGLIPNNVSANFDFFQKGIKTAWNTDTGRSGGVVVLLSTIPLPPLYFPHARV